MGDLPALAADRAAPRLVLILLALSAALVGIALSGVLDGLGGGSTSAAPPPLPPPAATPALPDRAPVVRKVVIVVVRPPAVQAYDSQRFAAGEEVAVPVSWERGFYPLYAVASRTFGVDWLLLASVHKQETDFSTAPSTYHGLNFAGCCGGPMQFNVRNGPITTWDRVSDSYLYAARPAAYDHATARHPSIYDDFDALMAAARLLAADGAGARLDSAAWSAAYDYYGHDLTGVTYADQVLARAIDWSQHGFCINCGVDPRIVTAVDAAYGQPVRAGLIAAERARERAARLKASTTRRPKPKPPTWAK